MGRRGKFRVGTYLAAEVGQAHLFGLVVLVVEGDSGWLGKESQSSVLEIDHVQGPRNDFFHPSVYSRFEVFAVQLTQSYPVISAVPEHVAPRSGQVLRLQMTAASRCCLARSFCEGIVRAWRSS